MKKRKRNRLKGFDYSSNNLYFVTICVHGMVCCFGDVVGTKGAVGTTRELSVRVNHPSTNSDSSARPNPSNDKSDKYVALNPLGKIANARLLWLEDHYKYVVLYSHIVMPNHVHVILEINSNLVEGEKIKIKSLSELMGAYKTTSSKMIHQIGNLEFKWQRSFHDHIIRNDTAYQKISNYIETNADKWKKDKFYN